MTDVSKIPFAPAASQQPGPILSAAQVARTGPTVTMFFKDAVLLTMPDRSSIQFRAGVQEVPEELADHWFLLKCGAVRYDKSSRTSPLLTAPQLDAKSRLEAAKAEVDRLQAEADALTLKEAAEANVAEADAKAKVDADKLAAEQVEADRLKAETPAADADLTLDSSASYAADADLTRKGKNRGK